MANLPHPWDMYGRLQIDLFRSRVVDDKSWGKEAALNRILAPRADDLHPTVDEVTLVAASEARRERRHLVLRAVHLGDEPPSFHPEAQLAARHRIYAAEAIVSTKDWSILSCIAAGHTYTEIASMGGGSPGRLRLRVLRLRKKLAPLAA